MTHDELLDRISQAGLEPHGNVMPTHLVLALRAVVELHKPNSANECLVCIKSINFVDKTKEKYPYPCPTIQAIEKELG